MSCVDAVADTALPGSAAELRRARQRSSVSTEIDRSDLAARIRAFVDDVIAPVAPAMARGDGPSPKRIVEAAGEAGLAGILTPDAYGGAGGSHADFIELIET